MSRVATHRHLPSTGAALIIGIGGRWKKITPLRDILFPLLTSNFNLLLLTTTAKVVLFEYALVLEICTARLTYDV